MKTNTAAGKVWLVGAGPGDPELLTLKAVRVIGEADVALVDDLVNPEVLVHLRPNARVIHVGKRGGCKSTPQAFIEKLLAAEALAGNTVVRLKGGDPFVFGRGGEETAALDAAGVACRYLEFGSYFSGWRRRNALKLWTGWPTFPMVFVKGVLIGGATDLERLIKSGELQRMLGERPASRTA